MEFILAGCTSVAVYYCIALVLKVREPDCYLTIRPWISRAQAAQIARWEALKS